MGQILNKLTEQMLGFRNGFNDQTFVSSEGQKIFTLTAGEYTPYQNRIEVVVAGSPQYSGINFTETSSTSFTLSEPLPAGIVVHAKWYESILPAVGDGENPPDGGGGGIVDLTDLFISVKDFGATPDGTANQNMLAFTKAITEAQKKGAKVYIPPGRYQVSKVQLLDGIVIGGTKGTIIEGCTFTASGVSNIGIEDISGEFGIDFVSVNNVRLRNLESRYTRRSFNFATSKYITVENCRIYDFDMKDNDKPIMYFSACEYGVISGNTIKNKNRFNDNPNTWNTGINPSSCKHFKILNNHVENCGGQGITLDTNNAINDPKIRESYHHIVMGNTCIANGQEGITVFSGLKQFETHHVTITNNICIDNHFDGIELWGVRWVTVSDNQITCPNPVTYSFGALNIYSSQDITASNNLIDNVPNSGICLIGFDIVEQYKEPNCKRVTMTNNIIKNWNNMDLTQHDIICGINLTASDYTVVTGNSFLHDLPRTNEVKAISLVSGRHYIKGNMNPSKLSYQDHMEADGEWGENELAERNGAFAVPALDADPKNPNPGAMWYDPHNYVLKYGNTWDSPVIAAVLIEDVNYGYPDAGYMEGAYITYQKLPGRLTFRMNAKSSNGLYKEFVMKDKFINMKPVDDMYVTKIPEPGDFWYDEIEMRLKYRNGNNITKEIPEQGVTIVNSLPFANVDDIGRLIVVKRDAAAGEERDKVYVGVETATGPQWDKLQKEAYYTTTISTDMPTIDSGKNLKIEIHLNQNAGAVPIQYITNGTQGAEMILVAFNGNTQLQHSEGVPNAIHFKGGSDGSKVTIPGGGNMTLRYINTVWMETARSF